MKIHTRIALIILATTALATVYGCQKKSAEKARQAKPLEQSQATEKQQDVDSGTSDKDAAVRMTEEEMNKAQKRAEAFMQKHGTEIIDRLANQQVRFFRLNLERGDALIQGKKPREAILAYRDSLATKTNDARTLFRIATAAFASGDMATARATCFLGLNRAYDPRVRAGILSLLGDIALKRSEDKEALYFYSSSEKTVPNRSIAKKIKPLQKKAKQPLPAEPHFIGGKMAPLGPARDLTELCGLLSQSLPKDTKGIQCDPSGATSIRAKEGTFQEAAYLPATSAKTEQHYVLAGKTDSGWYALAELAQVSQIVSLYSAGDKFEVTQFEFKQLVPGGPQELVISFTHGVEDSDPGINEVEKRVSRTLLICGQNGKELKCTKRIPTLLNRERTVLSQLAEAVIKPDEHLGKLPIKESFAFTADLSRPGKAIVKSKKPAAKKWAHLLGPIDLSPISP